MFVKAGRWLPKWSCGLRMLQNPANQYLSGREIDLQPAVRKKAGANQDFFFGLACVSRAALALCFNQNMGEDRPAFAEPYEAALANQEIFFALARQSYRRDGIFCDQKTQARSLPLINKESAIEARVDEGDERVGKSGVSILTSGRFRSSTEPSRSYACKDRNSDACAPGRSVLAESFSERSVDLQVRRRDDVVGRRSIDHHIGAEMIALQVFFNRIVSLLANFRDVAQPALAGEFFRRRPIFAVA
jgi:hypothetical protein